MIRAIQRAFYKALTTKGRFYIFFSLTPRLQHYTKVEIYNYLGTYCQKVLLCGLLKNNKLDFCESQCIYGSDFSR